MHLPIDAQCLIFSCALPHQQVGNVT